MTSVTTGVAWRVACGATFDARERAGAGAGALGACHVTARTAGASPGPRDGATVSSAIPTAGGVSAGVATTSTTGAGSGVVTVAGFALAGEAVAETVDVGVGVGGSGVVAVAGVAVAGEAVAGVLGVAADAAAFAAGAAALAAGAAALAAGAGGVAAGAGGLAAGAGGPAAGAGRFAAGVGGLAAGAGGLLAGAGRFAAGVGGLAAGAAGLVAGAGRFAAGAGGLAAGAGGLVAGAGVFAAGAGLLLTAAGLTAACAGGPLPVDLLGVSAVPGVAAPIADGATIAAPMQAHVNVATAFARARALFGPINREAPTGRHHRRQRSEDRSGNRRTNKRPVSQTTVDGRRTRLTQGERAYGTSIALQRYFSVTTKRARVTPSPSSLAPATTAPKVSR
jgi:putative membrane protein